MAQDIHGFGVEIYDPNAIAWCMLGALDKSEDIHEILSGDKEKMVDLLANKVVDQIVTELNFDISKDPEYVISMWQDDKRRTQQEVVEMMQWAEKQVLLN